MALISEDRASVVLEEYGRTLAHSTLADQSRRAYRSRVAGYLAWLAGDSVGGSDLGGGDPLSDRTARDRAVQEYHSFVVGERGARPSTANAILTALDHFYGQLRLGPAEAVREDQPASPPRILTDEQQRSFLSTVARHESVRDRAVACALFYTGVRVTELVALDTRDLVVGRSKARVIVRESGGQSREIPLRPEPVPVLRDWIRERRRWPDTGSHEALFLNRRGGRLTSRSVDELVVRLARAAGIWDDGIQVTPHVLRHTFAARLLIDGADIMTVAALMGHKRLDTTRRYLTARSRGGAYSNGGG